MSDRLETKSNYLNICKLYKKPVNTLISETIENENELNSNLR
jgi:hypothetical protein